MYILKLINYKNAKIISFLLLFLNKSDIRFRVRDFKIKISAI